MNIESEPEGLGLGAAKQAVEYSGAEQDSGSECLYRCFNYIFTYYYFS